jgi:hemolysin activation/secretion protein
MSVSVIGRVGTASLQQYGLCFRAMCLLAYIFLALVPASAAAEDTEESLSFTINGFDVEGNTLLDDATVDRIVAPYIGEKRNFGSVQQALDALEKAYAEIGYSTVLVTLPEQRLQDGTVKFNVVEGKLSAIEVDETRYFNAENILYSLKTLEVGKTPNIDDLSANLSLIGENPAKRVSVVFKPGQSDGEVIASVKTKEQNPIRFAATLDNTGTDKTGIFRAGLAAQHANLFNLDHILTAQVITSPDEHHRDVEIFAASYHIPLYDWDSSLDLIAGYSSVNSGQARTSVGEFAISGSGNVYEIHLTKNFPKTGEWEHKLSAGFSYRVFKTNVALVNTAQNLVPPLTIHPFDLTYVLSRNNHVYNFSSYLSLVKNAPFGNHGMTDDFIQFGARPHSKASYFLARYGLDYSYLFKSGWQGRLKFNGQATNDMLIPGEQFGIGGANSVRGLDERAFSNDHGYQLTLEGYTPEFGERFSDSLRMRALVFSDTGKVIRNHPDVGESPSTQVTSYGVGIRASYKEDLQMRLDFAYIDKLRDVINHHTHLHGQIVWTF